MFACAVASFLDFNRIHVFVSETVFQKRQKELSKQMLYVSNSVT